MLLQTIDASMTDGKPYAIRKALIIQVFFMPAQSFL